MGVAETAARFCSSRLARRSPGSSACRTVASFAAASPRSASPATPNSLDGMERDLLSARMVQRGRSRAMKFTLSWLKEHLDTDADVARGRRRHDHGRAGGRACRRSRPPSWPPFTVAKIVEAVQHPNADRLRVCQVDTIDGRKEIVCGAPNARAGLTTIYAPIGAYVPGLGVTLVREAGARRGLQRHALLGRRAGAGRREPTASWSCRTTWRSGTPAAEALRRWRR